MTPFLLSKDDAKIREEVEAIFELMYLAILANLSLQTITIIEMHIIITG